MKDEVLAVVERFRGREWSKELKEEMIEDIVQHVEPPMQDASTTTLREFIARCKVRTCMERVAEWVGKRGSHE